MSKNAEALAWKLAEARSLMVIESVHYGHDEVVVLTCRGSARKEIRVGLAAWAGAVNAEDQHALVEQVERRQFFFRAGPHDEAYRVVLEAGCSNWTNRRARGGVAGMYAFYPGNPVGRLMWRNQEYLTLPAAALVALVQKRFKGPPSPSGPANVGALAAPERVRRLLKFWEAPESDGRVAGSRE